jgi:hypothetical protein
MYLFITSYQGILRVIVACGSFSCIIDGINVMRIDFQCDHSLNGGAPPAMYDVYCC